MMRKLAATDFTSTTSYFDDSYYNDGPRELQSGPSLVLIVGLTMAFVGAAILIVVICCVCRKRQPPDSQGAMYERAATSDGQSVVTSYPLGPVTTGSAPSTQSGMTVSKTTSTATSQMSSGGPPMPHPQQPGQMYGGHPGHPGHQPYPGYPNAANMGPPYMYQVPQPSFQPMTTLAVFGAPDGAPPENSQANTSGGAPMPYSLYSPGPGEMKQPLPQGVPHHLQQEFQRQVNMAAQQYNTNQQQSSEFPRQQATAPPPPAPM
ncbi:calcium-binding protein P-like [Haliotis cracherodii]|uniref:calcium-binding protein P-like n=1 Tax=Haliotis cracherodii TaxID=6455 RepID=UPI0039EA7994